jgi:hypothetical protein
MSATEKKLTSEELVPGAKCAHSLIFHEEQQLRAEYALVDGVPEHHSEALFMLRYTEGGKRVYKALGKDPNKALAAKLKREYWSMAVKSGSRSHPTCRRCR